jgi:uncharacterized membrane protein
MTRLVAGALATLFLVTAPAHAELKLCNRTSYILYAATAATRNQQSSAQGWTRITPGDCQVARNELLSAETYLVYARSSLAHSGPAHAWGGNFPLCVKDANFIINRALTMPSCRAEDTFALPFAALDTHGARNWTMTLDETPALPSLAGAQLAGVKRLLRDNGYQTGPISAAVSKQTGAALADFRKAMHLADAGNAELFIDLEKEALKTNAPAGYTVCNDGSSNLQVALGQLPSGKPVSRGWWTVPPKACARAITTALTADTIYLLARKKDGSVVAGGAEKFCVAAAAFEITQRDHCADLGFAEAGFVRTPTKGLMGYTAHIGDHGLLPTGGAPKK